MDDRRQRLIAENEALYRYVNERIRSMRDRDFPNRFEIVCECGLEGCNEPIELEFGQYEEARQRSELFVVCPGHEIPGAEVVVADHGHYRVVQKVGEVAEETAREHDPRRNGGRNG